MRALGAAGRLWRVDVVLRGERSSENADAFLEHVRDQVGPDDGETAPFGDISGASSHDEDPPEGSVGVSCWVRSDAAGGAVDAAWEAVTTAARAVLGVCARCLNR